MSPRRRPGYDRGTYQRSREGFGPAFPGPEVDSVTRPFLNKLRVPAQEFPDEPGPPPDAVRPYLVTGGRVPDQVAGFETVYVATPEGVSRLGRLAFERRAIAELCRSAQSVAEISALLKLPLGVATVLTRDLAGEGYLTSSGAVDPLRDPDLIMRLIHGVRAL
jgi:hypothetical protein